MMAHKNRLFVSCLLSDGVDVFFLITGFFYFNKSFKKQFATFIKSILLPTLLLVYCSYVFRDWINNQESLFKCLQTFDVDFVSIFKGILALDVSYFGILPHLWYIFAYFQCMVMFPLLKCICSDDMPYISKYRRYIIIMSAILLLISDVQKIITFPFPLSSFSLIAAAPLYYIIGYELSINEMLMKQYKKCFGIVSIILFFVFNCIRCCMQYKLYQLDNMNEYYLYWYSIFGYICAVCLFIGILMLDIKNNFVSRVINYLGKRTFGIYLVHWLVMMKLDALGIKNIIVQWMLSSKNNLLSVVAYTMIYGIVIFVCSWFIMLILDLLKYIIRYCMNKLNGMLFA